MITRVGNQILLRTKLHRPSATADQVDRPRLKDRLDSSLDRPLILVAAPAGFGKSTLLSAWLEDLTTGKGGVTPPLPAAWLSLDESDNDLSVFLVYFLAAMQSIFPDALSETIALVSGLNFPPVLVIANSLSNELDGLERDFVLVLDDYHTIREQSIHDLLTMLLQHPPKGMRLVITTREDPPLPLGALRARNRVAEIRGHDLRFSPTEIAAFVERTLGAPLAEDALAVLAEKTEGWAAALRLATLTLRHSGDAESQIAGLYAENRYLMDYLVREVLSSLPPHIQSFLLKTAILDRLSGPLCDAITRQDESVWSGQQYLEWLVDANVFTASLDSQGQWFRYHHLFQTLLLDQMKQRHSAQEIVALHAGASAWYASNGFVVEAISHALAAGDEDAAVKVVQAHRHQAMNEERWQQLEHWLRCLPQRLVDQRPELLLLRAWMLQVRYQFAALPPYLDRIDALLERSLLPEPEITWLRSEIDALRCVHYSIALDSERTSTHAACALQTVPMKYSFVRGQAWLYYAGSLAMIGDLEGARDAFHTGLKEDRFHGNTFPTRLYMGLGFLNWISADLSSLIQIADHLLNLAGERGLTESAAWARYFRGCAAYQRNDLARAESEFAAVVGQRYVAHDIAFSQSALGLASVYQAQGNTELARAVVASALAHALETNNARGLIDAQVFQMRLLQQQGQEIAAQKSAGLYTEAVQPVLMSIFHVTPICMTEVLLSQGTAESLLSASHLLPRLRAFVETIHNTRFLVEVLALQALLHEAYHESAAAQDALTQALLLAQPGGLVRVFVDRGPRMAHLLAALARKGVAPDYINQILQAFGKSAPAAPTPRDPNHWATGSAAFPPLGRAELVTHLTDREHEILALLAQRLSNKEIAQALVISPQTVKRHIANLYEKLQAGGRREAVAVAIRLGLLQD